jgi:shikimate kinase
MGAGKSTIGPLLANRLSWRFIDADHYLQEKTGATIPELFSRLGEAEFRRLEAEAFTELHRETELVLALGGGAVETESTRALLANAENTHVVFLKASFDTLIERCERQTAAVARPLLQQRGNLSHRFHARLRYYEQAHTTITTEGLDPHAVVDRILNVLVDDLGVTRLTSKAMDN